MDDERFIEIPWDALPPDTLHALVEEFVTRDGTDYGEVEASLEDKVGHVLLGLKQSRWMIVFDSEASSTHIVDRDQVRFRP